MQDSVFTKIIKRELPAQILFEDDFCIAMLTIRPHNPGHCLIIPRQQIENWEDLPRDLYLHCMLVTKALAKIIKKLYRPKKLSIATAGFEVPHVHIHLIPLYKLTDLDSATARDASPDQLKVEADKIRAEIASAGMEIGK